jgi:hypothetical protein
MRIDVYEIAVIIFGVVAPLVFLRRFSRCERSKATRQQAKRPPRYGASASAMGFAHSQIETVQS